MTKVRVRASVRVRAKVRVTIIVLIDRAGGRGEIRACSG